MTLLYFSPVLWDSYPQRPHFFAKYFLQRGGRLVWIDPYPTRLPTFADLRRLNAPPRAKPARPPGVSVITLNALPLEPFSLGRWLNRTMLWKRLSDQLEPLLRGSTFGIGVGRPSEVALKALHSLDAQWSFYDAMDDFPEFYQGLSKRSVAANEREIANTVDIVVTCSTGLAQKFEALGDRRHTINNAFDMTSLPPAPTVQRRRTVFGYVGCISEWFDWSAVARLADARPESTVHLIGPCVSRPPDGLPSNVTMSPECSHDDAVAYMQTFSVGLIPFKRSPLTHCVDPIKYYSYRAMGLPVLTTTFGEMAQRGAQDDTYFMDNGAGVGEAADAAVASLPSAAAVDAFRRQHDWQQRFGDAGLFERLLPC